MTDTTNTAAAGQKMPRKPTGKLAFAYATIMQLEAQVAELREAIGAGGVSGSLMGGAYLPAVPEAVATVFTMEAMTPGAGVKYHATIHKPLPAGTKLYASPVPAVPAGWVMVPVAFVQGFNTLAHNYSLRAIPPDCYWGTEGDAFSAAYRRCGEDLAKLRAQLEAIGAAGYSAGDMAAQGAEQFRAGQASMLAAGERKPLDAAQRRALLESVDHYNFPGDLIRATEAAHGIAAQQGDSHE